MQGNPNPNLNGNFQDSNNNDLNNSNTNPQYNFDSTQAPMDGNYQNTPDPSYNNFQDPAFQDNNLYTDPNQQQYNTQPLADEYANDYNQSFYNNDYPNQTDPNSQTYNTDYQSDLAQPIEQNDAIAEQLVDNTPKKSNRLFYIIAGFVIVLLIGILSIFGFYAINSRNNSTASNNSSSSSESAVEQSSQESQSQDNNQANSQEVSSTPESNFRDPKGPTPVSLARKFNVNEVPSDWLKQEFSSNDVDNSGKCLNEDRCGNTSDVDNDGLNTVEEYNYQTKPLLIDTDADGLSDGDEVKVYLTNPVVRDSDLDKINDGDEIKTCFDPALNTTNKLAKDRIQEYAKNISSSNLHNSTIDMLKKSNASESDLKNGYILSTCGNGVIDLSL
jgi:hypothetical protein